MLSEKVSKNILIIGAGRAGKLLKKDVEQAHPECHVIGFVDDKPDSENRLLLGTLASIGKLVRLFRIDEIIIAIPSTDGKLVRNILLQNIKNHVPIRIVPRNQKIIRLSQVRYDEVREITGEDFLGRPFMRQNIAKVNHFYHNKTVFITGGAGSIGSDIVRQLLDLDVKKIVVYDNSEYLIFLLEQELKVLGLRERCELIVGSILHYNKLNIVMKTIRPDIVFHAAAYKHVHLMQDNIDEAVYNNVIGTKRVIEAAMQSGVKLFTFISTDKVVNPTSIMGATKKLCEYYIQSLHPKGMKFNIVRFGNVINSNGSALPLFERQIARQGYVTVTHRKMKRFFMSIREAAQLVIESTAKGKTDTIHILNMGELINIYEIALCLIRAKGFVPGKDTEVRITGLRKGEKMIEELYTESERGNIIKTSMDHIFSLKNYDQCPVGIVETIDTLEEMVKGGAGQKELYTELKKIFPSIKDC